MGTTTATVYFKPRLSDSLSTATEAVVFFPLRFVSGQYSTALSSKRSKKNWKPDAIHPLVDKNGLIDPAWNRYLSDIGGRKLGGANFPTLPELTNFITLAQQNASAVTQLQSALQQMVTANAQALQSVIEVTKTAALAGAAQIPPPVLAAPETNIPALPPSAGAGAGGDGGGDGGGD